MSESEGGASITDAAAALAKLRGCCPLVECLTNFVSAPLMADGLLALGASPAMISDPDEAARLAAAADALLVNPGTVDLIQSAAMRRAVLSANAADRPWALDPVGVGALPLRTDLCRELLRESPAIIRGNASEIIVLAGAATDRPARGVDSTARSDEAVEAAMALSAATRAAVLVSGPTDYICLDGESVLKVAEGSPMMTKIAGTGCLQGAIAAAFLGALGREGRRLAAFAAALVSGVAGMQAAARVPGPGSFRAAFLDEISQLERFDRQIVPGVA